MRIGFIKVILVFCFTQNYNVVYCQSETKNGVIKINSIIGRNYVLGNSVANPGMSWGIGAQCGIFHNLSLGSNLLIGASSGTISTGSYRNSFNIYDAELGYNKKFINEGLMFLKNSSIQFNGGVALINSTINSWSTDNGTSKNDMSFFAYKLSLAYTHNLLENVYLNVLASHYFAQTGILDGRYNGKNDAIFILSAGIGINISNNNRDTEDKLLKATQENTELNKQLLLYTKKIDETNQILSQKLESNNLLLSSKIDSVKYNLKNAQEKSINNTPNYKLEDAPKLVNDTSNYIIKYPNSKYNVVYGGFLSVKNALNETQSLRKSGVNVEPFWKGDKSRLVFLVVYSTNDFKQAQEKLRSLRKKGYSDVWIYTFNPIKN